MWRKPDISMAPAHTRKVSVTPGPTRWCLELGSPALPSKQYTRISGCCAGGQRTAEGHLAVALAEVHVAHAELAPLDKDGQVHLQPRHMCFTRPALLRALPQHQTQGGASRQWHAAARRRAGQEAAAVRITFEPLLRFLMSQLPAEQ